MSRIDHHAYQFYRFTEDLGTLSSSSTSYLRKSATNSYDGSDGDSFDSARTVSDRKRDIENHYRSLFSEVVAELSVKIRRHPDCVADGLASALYEVSYLRARDYLQAASRRQKQRVMRNNASASEVGNALHANPIDAGTRSYSVREVREAFSAVRYVSKALQVCWTICGTRLCKIKAKAVEKKQSYRGHRPKIYTSATTVTATATATATGSCGWGDTPSSSMECRPASRTTVSTLLGGVNDRMFKPAISLSFVPPPITKR
jgi:hypothetical protein